MKNYVPFLFVFAFLLAVFGFEARPVKSATPAFNFPAGETAYQITTSKGSLPAMFKYAPAIQNIKFNTTNLNTYIGNHFKNIFWIANRYGGGPAGRWDISDPWNPKGPDVVGIAQGGSAFAVGSQPSEHQGPFWSGVWPHPPSLAFSGGAFADLANGAARFVFGSGSEGVHPGGPDQDRLITPALQLEGGEGISIGQLLDPKAQGYIATGSYVVDATTTGKFFFIGAGGYDPNTTGNPKNALQVFDVTNLTGGIDFGDSLIKASSSKSWQNVTELNIIEVPGKKNHILIARTANAATENPKFYIGEIDAATGQIIGNNPPVTLSVQTNTDTSKNTLVYPGSNIKFANVAGSTYVFMNESFTPGGQLSTIAGTLKVAVYKFNPADMSFTRKGDITLPNFPAFNYANRKDIWSVARTDDSSTPPLFMAVSTSQTLTSPQIFVDSVPHSILFDFNFYSINNILNSSAPVSITGTKGDIVIPGIPIQRPIALGQIITGGVEQAGTFGNNETYHVFLKKENSRTNLYLYRKSYIFVGVGASDPVMAYGEIPITAEQENRDPIISANRLSTDFRGVTSLRIDKVDVTAFGNTTSSPPTPPPGTSSISSSCAAALTFNQTSVPYGSSMTESWTVTGADVGQVYGDCGQGATPISAGPQSYTFENLTKTMTCRVYGNIGGKEACTVSATVVVGPPPASGGRNADVYVPLSDNSQGTAFQYFYPNGESSQSVAPTSAILRQGSSGNEVIALQSFLNQDINAGLSPDGKFGPKTRAAVVTWQSNHYLTPDGVVGPKTRAAMGQ
jgi:hypothetical protein